MNKQQSPLKMEHTLRVDQDKINRILELKIDYFKNRITLEEAKLKLQNAVDFVTPDEFALCEQQLSHYGISDDVIAERIEEIVEIFDGVLKKQEFPVPEGHPIHTYLMEVKEIRNLMDQLKKQLQKKFIKNQWLELYDQLEEIHTHFARKQNQLFPRFEDKGFDKPSKVMWTLENKIRDKIQAAKNLLVADRDDEFLSMQQEVIVLIEDMMDKEEEILYPTALKMIPEEEFSEMRKGDEEIGYAFGISPKEYVTRKLAKDPSPKKDSFIDDLGTILEKHGFHTPISDSKQVLDVASGELTLEQINLIFKHIPVDLSFVDENEIVKFYSDTKHRIFPRSPGVIGRKVENCHPRESVDAVIEIVDTFKSGREDQAEFWLEIGDQFIYILFIAVRDDQKKFKGVLEVMQDVTRIRDLKGSQRLLTWEKNKSMDPTDGSSSVEKDSNQKFSIEENQNNQHIFLNKATIVGDLVKKYPYIKEELLQLSPKFSKLKNPILFKAMSSIATLEMIADRGNLDVESLITHLKKRIQEENTSA